MHVGSRVTIRSIDTAWEGARIVATDLDSLTGTRPVFLVWHPFFRGSVGFFQQPDAWGRRLNVDRATYWLEEALSSEAASPSVVLLPQQGSQDDLLTRLHRHLWEATNAALLLSTGRDLSAEGEIARRVRFQLGVLLRVLACHDLCSLDVSREELVPPSPQQKGDHA